MNNGAPLVVIDDPICFKLRASSRVTVTPGSKLRGIMDKRRIIEWRAFGYRRRSRAAAKRGHFQQLLLYQVVEYVA